MNKKVSKFKSILNYLSTVITWSLFVILISCAVILAYYYLSVQICNKKGEKCHPPFSIYTIVSNSMYPKIKVYDIIVNTWVNNPEDIKVGNIITFISTSNFSRGMTITHRVKEVQKVDGEYQYVTQGDNNQFRDESPALYSNLIGKAQFKLPQLGRIQFFVASKAGWMIVVIIPALIIIIKDVIKIIKINDVKKDASIANEKLLMSENFKDDPNSRKE